MTKEISAPGAGAPANEHGATASKRQRSPGDAANAAGGDGSLLPAAKRPSLRAVSASQHTGTSIVQTPVLFGGDSKQREALRSQVKATYGNYQLLLQACSGPNSPFSPQATEGAFQALLTSASSKWTRYVVSVAFDVRQDVVAAIIWFAHIVFGREIDGEHHRQMFHSSMNTSTIMLACCTTFSVLQTACAAIKRRII